MVWAIDFGKMSFDHAEQFRDTLFIPFLWALETQAFMTGCFWHFILLASEPSVHATCLAENVKVTGVSHAENLKMIISALKSNL